ncbi:hypothetical protein [Curtobacterium sp. MCBD17_040]|uniref:hypothetical protein n=1 Tax=Curtobacterium sp. MCBD17_040 TaxID=2175674 RepID=UPI0011B4E9EF|nr:hypothetical protein [Curtobacterium sp. MCBD17_040]WIB65517.1 hypothetical protein DEI94_19275 [Curtobacterium sp. MCBD17_040]
MVVALLVAIAIPVGVVVGVTLAARHAAEQVDRPRMTRFGKCTFTGTTPCRHVPKAAIERYGDVSIPAGATIVETSAEPYRDIAREDPYLSAVIELPRGDTPRDWFQTAAPVPATADSATAGGLSAYGVTGITTASEGAQTLWAGTKDGRTWVSVLVWLNS